MGNSEISEELRSFGDYLRSFVEIGPLGSILYPFYHCLAFYERGIN